MKRTITFLLLIGTTLLSGQAHAASADTEISTTQAMVAERFGNLGLNAKDFTVRPVTEIDGLFEVSTKNGAVYFTDAIARYLIAGHLIDPIKRVDLTMQHINAQRISVLNEAIKTGDLFVTGDKSAEDAVVIFDDPDCPYCRRLEKALTNDSGILAYHVMSPLTQLHPRAKDHASIVLCSKNKGRKLLSIMDKHAEHQPIAQVSKACAEKADKLWPTHIRLTEHYGVNGTPYIVRLRDGQVWNGYMPMSFLKRWAAGEEIDPQKLNVALQAGF